MVLIVELKKKSSNCGIEKKAVIVELKKKY
jgi:indole-3-glycerol phosphate synthase